MVSCVPASVRVWMCYMVVRLVEGWEGDGTTVDVPAIAALALIVGVSQSECLGWEEAYTAVLGRVAAKRDVWLQAAVDHAVAEYKRLVQERYFITM